MEVRGLDYAVLIAHLPQSQPQGKKLFAWNSRIPACFLSRVHFLYQTAQYNHFCSGFYNKAIICAVKNRYVGSEVICYCLEHLFDFSQIYAKVVKKFHHRNNRRTRHVFGHSMKRQWLIANGTVISLQTVTFYPERWTKERCFSWTNVALAIDKWTTHRHIVTPENRFGGCAQHWQNVRGQNFWAKLTSYHIVRKFQIVRPSHKNSSSGIHWTSTVLHWSRLYIILLIPQGGFQTLFDDHMWTTKIRTHRYRWSTFPTYLSCTFPRSYQTQLSVAYNLQID